MPRAWLRRRRAVKCDGGRSGGRAPGAGVITLSGFAGGGAPVAPFTAEQSALLRRFFRDGHAGPVDRRRPRVGRDGGIPPGFADARAEHAFPFWREVGAVMLGRHAPDTGASIARPMDAAVQAQPAEFLFELLWPGASSADGRVESYWLGRVPGTDRGVVLVASGPEARWHGGPMAIGWFRDRGDLLMACGGVIRRWWTSQRAGWQQLPWQELRRLGRIPAAEALAWSEQVWRPAAPGFEDGPL